MRTVRVVATAFGILCLAAGYAAAQRTTVYAVASCSYGYCYLGSDIFLDRAGCESRIRMVIPGYGSRSYVEQPSFSMKCLSRQIDTWQ